MLPIDSAESTGSVFRLCKRSELSASAAASATAVASASPVVFGAGNAAYGLVQEGIGLPGKGEAVFPDIVIGLRLVTDGFQLVFQDAHGDQEAENGADENT